MLTSIDEYPIPVLKYSIPELKSIFDSQPTKKKKHKQICHNYAEMTDIREPFNIVLDNMWHLH